MTTSVTDSAAHQSANLYKYEYDNFIYQKVIRAFLARIYEMLEEANPETILDAGCGEGFVVDYLAQRNSAFKLTGVDVSEGALAYAREHYGEHATFRKGSVYKLPFSDNSFDAVLCSEVLEHLDEPLKAVGELKRVARSTVLITVPREPYFKWLNDMGRAIGVSLDPGHVNFWTKRSFQDFINAHFDEAEFEWKHMYQLARATL